DRGIAEALRPRGGEHRADDLVVFTLRLREVLVEGVDAEREDGLVGRDTDIGVTEDGDRAGLESRRVTRPRLSYDAKCAHPKLGPTPLPPPVHAPPVHTPLEDRGAA